MIDSTASRMFRAISLGVFCRAAPSTERDHPVDEGLARLRGDLDDDPVGQHLGAAGDSRTVAAGLTDHRSGLTGDGRLVDAGDALDDVAVAGDRCRRPRRRPGRRSCSSVAATCSSEPSARSRRAMVPVRALRRVSACALPRPSATASARLAKTTVSHSQTVMDQEKTSGLSTASTVVMTAPTSTTNMTGAVPHGARVELPHGLRERADELGRLEGTGPDPSPAVTAAISGALLRAVRAPAPGGR